MEWDLKPAGTLLPKIRPKSADLQVSAADAVAKLIEACPGSGLAPPGGGCSAQPAWGDRTCRHRSGELAAQGFWAGFGYEGVPYLGPRLALGSLLVAESCLEFLQVLTFAIIHGMRFPEAVNALVGHAGVLVFAQKFLEFPAGFQWFLQTAGNNWRKKLEPIAQVLGVKS